MIVLIMLMYHLFSFRFHDLVCHIKYHHTMKTGTAISFVYGSNMYPYIRVRLARLTGPSSLLLSLLSHSLQNVNLQGLHASFQSQQRHFCSLLWFACFSGVVFRVHKPTYNMSTQLNSCPKFSNACPQRYVS